MNKKLIIAGALAAVAFVAMPVVLTLVTQGPEVHTPPPPTQTETPTSEVPFPSERPTHITLAPMRTAIKVCFPIKGHDRPGLGAEMTGWIYRLGFKHITPTEFKDQVRGLPDVTPKMMDCVVKYLMGK